VYKKSMCLLNNIINENNIKKAAPILAMAILINDCLIEIAALSVIVFLFKKNPQSFSFEDIFGMHSRM